MRALLNLLFNLPWWASLAIVAGLAVAGYALAWYFRHRFDKICRDAVLEVGDVLKDAEVTVHSVQPVPLPSRSSPYDIKPDDEEFVEGVDDEPWDEDGVSYYAIDATITPKNPLARWDPTALSLVPADYQPDDPVEITDKICPLHSAEIFSNDRFLPAQEVELQGPQRLRMTFAVHDGLRAVKFALFVTYFGRVDLAAPLAKGRMPSSAARRG
ncbi:MAG TPA: hypothetical protein VLM40_12330 [Gemmata sp.]|nr:hypothetical protein [Gemmata sp.]